MKRLHIHSKVSDLDASIAFYSAMFDAQPSVIKSDYAKWLLDDPRVNFAISTSCDSSAGIEHLGIQVENAEELGEVYDRLKAAARPVLEEGETTCCYAQSEKSWISDPDGIVWETFLTKGAATQYGEGPTMAEISCAPTDGTGSAKSCCG